MTYPLTDAYHAGTDTWAESTMTLAELPFLPVFQSGEPREHAAEGHCNVTCPTSCRTLDTMHRDVLTGRYTTPTVPDEERFWVGVDKSGDCWLWTFGKTGAGYGVFYPGNGEGKQVGAHVWSWIAANGPIPDDLVVDHLCRIRHCVRPDHLSLKTRGGNVLVSEITRAGRNMRKTHCDRGHELAGENLRIVRNYRNPELPPWRNCRECSRQRKRSVRVV